MSTGKSDSITLHDGKVTMFLYHRIDRYPKRLAIIIFTIIDHLPSIYLDF